MALTSRTADLFLIQPTHEKQAFLRLVLKSAAWRHGELQIQFEEPFENLKRSNQVSRRKDSEIGEGTTRNQIWLPGMDSNHDSRHQRECWKADLMNFLDWFWRRLSFSAILPAALSITDKSQDNAER
jgi:hypothetical protein